MSMGESISAGSKETRTLEETSRYQQQWEVSMLGLSKF